MLTTSPAPAPAPSLPAPLPTRAPTLASVALPPPAALRWSTPDPQRHMIRLYRHERCSVYGDCYGNLTVVSPIVERSPSWRSRPELWLHADTPAVRVARSLREQMQLPLVQAGPLQIRARFDEGENSWHIAP